MLRLLLYASAIGKRRAVKIAKIVTRTEINKNKILVYALQKI